MARSAAPACPICGKPPSETARPFCSTRCQKIDLGRWLDERYRIPSVEDDDADSTDGDADR